MLLPLPPVATHKARDFRGGLFFEQAPGRMPGACRRFGLMLQIGIMAETCAATAPVGVEAVGELS